jgi:hypothetical protein
MYFVKEIESKEAYPYLLNIHYAKRIPSISYAFGLFYKDELSGVVTYGTPPSAPLRIGLAGLENSHRILELNRLCLKHNKKNEASMLVGRSLKLLKKGTIVISFADTGQGHIGTVYQACNFVYCGLSEKRTDWKIKGLEHLHGQTIADKFRHIKNGRANELRRIHGDDFYLKPRPRKHRYVYIVGGKDYSVLKYEIKPYPKKNKTY